MDEPPTYDRLDRQLVSAMPELADRYDALLRAWGDEAPGPHVVFGDVLNPFLLGLLASEESAAPHATTLRRVFAFLERLAQDGDPRVQEIVWATVCERLGDDPDVLARGRRYMGEATRRLSHEAEAFWDMIEADESQANPVAAARP